MFPIQNFQMTEIIGGRLISRVTWTVDMPPWPEWDDMDILSANDELGFVNDYVANECTYKEDGDRDIWKAPNDFFADGFGDCEDHCVGKYALLRGLGWQSSRMAVLAIKDVDGARHAVLCVEHSMAGPVILDNRTPIIHRLEDAGWLTPIYAVNEKHAWFYRRETP